MQRYMSGLWARYMKTKAGHEPLHPLQSLAVTGSVLCRDSEYFLGQCECKLDRYFH